MLVPTAALAVLLWLALGLEEVFFFELAGLGTTFFIETGDFRFDVDFFGGVACFLAATFFDEVFFEVPFLLDAPEDFPVPVFLTDPAFLEDAAFLTGGLFLAEAVFFPEAVLFPEAVFFPEAAFFPEAVFFPEAIFFPEPAFFVERALADPTF